MDRRVAAVQLESQRFSPHPWGWTENLVHGPGDLRVFPTPVGMDRLWASRLLSALGFPHTRGDGPAEADRVAEVSRFSPHPWGWTGQPARLGLLIAVFPTPVGMDLDVEACEVPVHRFPHTRGDGPRP